MPDSEESFMLLIKWDVKKDKYKKTEEGKESRVEEEEE